MHALIIATFFLTAPEFRCTGLQATDLAEQPSPTVQDPAADLKAEYEKRKKEAEGNVDKLWKLYEWCEASLLKNESRNTLRAILKVDEGDRGAHKLLGHVEFEGKWYESEKKVEEYKRKQLESQAKASGKVIYKGELVDPADLPFLQKGWTKDASGKWIDAEAQKKLAEGWVRQDTNWIPPAEAENIAKGLWKCGEKWLSVEEANKYHAEIAHWWIVANEHFIVYSTCPRKSVEVAIEQCDVAYRDLMRTFGIAPSQPVPVILLNSKDQYASFATADLGNTNPDASGLSSTHGAYLGESYTDFLSTGQTLPGIAYWDPAMKDGDLWGPIFARNAAGQAFGEALDPSPKAMAKLLKGEGGSAWGDAFWAEKQLPQWFRYGAAAYVERYAAKKIFAKGGDPFENRPWSVANITRMGGLDPFDRIFKFEIGPTKQEDSEKLINEVGLLLAFVLDGKCAEVQAKLGALKDALKKNKEIAKAAQALADEIKRNEAKLRTFASL